MAKKVTINGSNIISSLSDAWGGNNNSSSAQTIYGTSVPAGAEWGINRGEVERFVKAQMSSQQTMTGYYTCATAAATAAKTVAASGYALTVGGCIRIKMNNANTANNVTLNINSTGAKALHYLGSQASSSNSWVAGDVLEVFYDGVKFQCAGWEGDKFSTGEKVRNTAIADEVTENSEAIVTSGAVAAEANSLKASVGYYECNTAAVTPAKTVSASGYKLMAGGNIRIKMTNANTAANVTLNINSTGAYPLYYNGVQASASNTWEAGDVLEVYYDGANFQCASGGGGGEFASGEKVSDVSIEDKVKSDSNALPTSAAVSEAIPAIAKIGDNDHLLDLVDTNGNVIFYVDSSFVFHALGNSSDESDDDEIPSKGLVKALIEAALPDTPTGEGDVIVREGDNDHILDVCDENGYLLFYVDSDFTFHALNTSLSFHLPDTINSFVGDTLQMFFYPMLLSTDYNNVGINMFVEGEALKCKSLKRYAEYAPDSAGTKTMKLNILDEKLGILAQRQISVNVITPASPSTMKNILLIGDSETEGYVNNSTVSPSADGMTTAMRYPYGKEMKRILTSNDAATDTAPAGLGLTNIQFVGHHATSGVRHEGYGGRSASWFMGTSSPFYINGAIDFNAYLAQDSMYDDTTHKGADYIYILLGANAGATTSVLGGQLIINATPYKTAMIDLLNAIKNQIINGVGTYANPNLKVILLSYCISNPTGGAYHGLGQGEYGNGMRVPLTYYQYHMVNNELAAMDDYSSFVVSEYVSFEIDSEHAYAYINKQVNRYSSETERTFIENVHPNEIGYKMYGQAVARDFLSRI